jgi:hypothetical protein
MAGFICHDLYAKLLEALGHLMRYRLGKSWQNPFTCDVFSGWRSPMGTMEPVLTTVD